jgi:hypothetical protein
MAFPSCIAAHSGNRSLVMAGEMMVSWTKYRCWTERESGDYDGTLGYNSQIYEITNIRHMLYSIIDCGTVLQQASIQAHMCSA